MEGLGKKAPAWFKGSELNLAMKMLTAAFNESGSV